MSRRFERGARARARGGIACLAAALSACSSPPADPLTRGLDRADRYVQRTGFPSNTDDTPAPARPLAILNDEPITLDALRPALLESAGAVALEEAALDRILEREAASKSIAIDQTAIHAEETLLLESFSSAGLTSSSDDAARLLASIRAARGLGPNRYPALLRRNALLRALVAPEVVITHAAIAQARTLRASERFRARVIVVPDASDAAETRRRLAQGEDFSLLAAERSTDPTALRGGLLDPISPADPTYPVAVRTALRSMKPGDTSDPVAVDQGFAILRLDRIEPPASQHAETDPESIRASIERDVRTDIERIHMDQRARALLEQARLTILDPNLHEAWRTRTRRTGP